ncbi:hypothetical protein ACJJTC_003972 [Scirpophaga incertulas]
MRTKILALGGRFAPVCTAPGCAAPLAPPGKDWILPQERFVFYTGQIKISHETVLPVLSLADKYNVKDLVTLCLEYMKQHIAKAAKRGQLIAWMQYTGACGHNDVAKTCQNFVKWNLEWVWSDAELASLDGETLVQLLQQDDLVLHNEMSLYQFVERWLHMQREKYDTSDLSEVEVKMHWESLVVAVFSHIRFPMMCPKQLAKLLLCPLTQDHKEFFMEKMAVAMRYQAGTSGVSGVTPRLYTDDTWGSVLAVEHYQLLPCYHTRTFIFSTRASTADVPNGDKLTEWTVDLYPKGVWFRKSLLIDWAGTYDVPEVVLRTVRISITCQSSVFSGPENSTTEPDIRVKIGILVWGVQKGVEHVTSVVTRVHRFSPQNRVLNIDGALDFDELNTPLYSPASRSPRPESSSQKTSSLETTDATESCHLLGPNKDQLRIQVIILPLTNTCRVGPDSIG